MKKVYPLLSPIVADQCQNSSHGRVWLDGGQIEEIKKSGLSIPARSV